MWRRLLRRLHPDHGGEPDLFVWTNALREHVAGDAIEDTRLEVYERRRPPPHPQATGSAGERVPFGHAYDDAAGFGSLTMHALALADEVGEPYRAILRRLIDCAPAEDPALSRQERQGATYKQLAYLGHLGGLSGAQRREWYRIAESIPLSERHAGFVISKIKMRAA